MKKIDYALLIGLVGAVMLSSLTGFAAECDELRSEMLRLHILASSDSEEDQALKYELRDRILAESEALFSEKDYLEAREYAKEHLIELEAIACEVLRENGRSDNVDVSLVNMYFGTRIYDETLVAAGWYDAVRITIGEGNGQNWWCVMFPPMCLPAVAEGGAAELCEQIENFGQEKYIPRFAIIELAEKAKNHLWPRDEASVIY